MRFDECLDFVLEREGGFVDHPNDRGGATNQGITQRVYDAWRACRGEPAQSVAEIHPAEVYQIYLHDYWRPVAADEVPPPLDLCLFDSAVNHGVGRAIKLLQRAVGAVSDGSFGPQTQDLLAAEIGKFGVFHVVERFIDERQDFYARIIDRDPSQRVFARGWSNRLKELRRAIT